ncbi:MAG: hypothetical protein ACLFVP_04700 [Candidatus Bathyarchaeia archaeon]
MKSYVKLYGPPILDALNELRKIAVNMPEVCIMDTVISEYTPRFDSQEGIVDFFRQEVGVRDLTIERCDTIISDSGEALGDYDFFFEWFKEPNMDELNLLIERIDESLEPLGCKYTITTKK